MRHPPRADPRRATAEFDEEAETCHRSAPARIKGLTVAVTFLPVRKSASAKPVSGQHMHPHPPLRAFLLISTSGRVHCTRLSLCPHEVLLGANEPELIWNINGHSMLPCLTGLTSRLIAGGWRPPRRSMSVSTWPATKITLVLSRVKNQLAGPDVVIWSIDGTRFSQKSVRSSNVRESVSRNDPKIEVWGRSRCRDDPRESGDIGRNPRPVHGIGGIHPQDERCALSDEVFVRNGFSTRALGMPQTEMAALETIPRRRQLRTEPNAPLYRGNAKCKYSPE